MLNSKDISTWTTSDISSWLKSINLTQYISKFELNKINGYDLIYLTKEDLKNLGIVNIHDKNVILNSMKKALLQQLKINVNYKNKFVVIQLDFDPNYTVEQLTQSFKTIFKPSSEIFLVVNNNEILMPNLKIIDLILYEPNIYKNFKIVSDEITLNINNNNNYNNIYPNTEDNNKKILTKTPNKNVYKNYYNNNNINNDLEKEYRTLGNTNYNNKYTKSVGTFDNLENLYNSKKYDFDKKDLKNYSNSINNNVNKNEEYYINYKTYNDYNKMKEQNLDHINNNINKNITSNINNNINNNLNDNLNNNYENKLEKEIKINNNNLYEYSNKKNLNKNDISTAAYRKNYSIKNGELNLDIKNFNLNNIKKEEEDDGQKYSSEKRNYRLKELNLKRNYGNNLNENNSYIGKKNYNYDMNALNEIKDERLNYTSATGGFM